MGKLQPNFSWQKYEGQPEDQKEQFQYQLQSQHIQVANSVNTTIDDESFWARERQTSFTWIDGRAIWTKTIQGTVTTAPGVTLIPHGLTLRQVVSLSGLLQDAVPMALVCLPLPFLDLITPANSVEFYIDTANIVIITTSATWLNYIATITIEYTK